MKELDQLRAVYNKAYQNFDDDLQSHLNDGIVISTPDAFIMARATQIADGRMVWAIAGAAGNLRTIAADALRLFPNQLNWCMFRRHGEKRERIYPTAKLFRKILC